MRRLIVAIIVLLLLAGGASAQQRTGTLRNIQDTGVFRIGYFTDSEPFSSLNPQGTPVGYSLDLCRRIAAATQAELGLKEMKIEFVPITLKNRFDAVEGGKVDIECGTSTITMSRLERVDFTLMTFVTGGGLLSRANTPVNQLSEMAGKTVAVKKNTTTEGALQAYLDSRQISAKVVKVDDDAAGMVALTEGTADAYASDQVKLIGQIIKSHDLRGFALAKDLFSYEPYGLMVRRNDADFRLVANRALSHIYRSGEHQGLYQKWFSAIGIEPSPILLAMYQLQTIPD